jgi:NAD(P)-dependent dehydrogenase (short-subunit alcohol dehydrogenase family)
MSFKGKVVAVSGAAGGTGQSVCRYLASEGAAIATEGIIRVQDTFPTYWPEFDGVRGGALRDEFAYFATCALNGKTPSVGRPEDAAAALEATLAAEESARTGNVIRIGGN